MKRAIMSFVMVFVLMFGFCCIPKMAEGDSNLGTSGLYYSPVVGGYLVCGYEGIDADIIIPDTYIDGDVIGFVEHAFESSQINSVTMGANIKEISDDAFWDCKLTQVKLNEGLEVLGGFREAPYLTEVTVPSTVTKIDNLAFFRAIRLQNVHFEKGSQLEVIDSGAFKHCASLQSINLEDTNLINLEAAFANCVSIKELHLPASCTNFGGGVFEGWTSDQTIYFGCSRKSIQYINNGYLVERNRYSESDWDSIIDNMILQGCEAKVVFPD